MLRCADDRFYVGSFRGDDLDWRVWQHNAGVHPTAWTFKRRPVELVWSEHFDFFIDAFTAERRIKGWSRAKKEALIRGDYAEVSRLAQSRTPKPSTFAQRLAAGPLTDDQADVARPALVLRQAQDEG